MFVPVFSIGSVVMVCVIWPSDMICVVVGWLLGACDLSSCGFSF